MLAPQQLPRLPLPPALLLLLLQGQPRLQAQAASWELPPPASAAGRFQVPPLEEEQQQSERQLQTATCCCLGDQAWPLVRQLPVARRPLQVHALLNLQNQCNRSALDVRSRVNLDSQREVPCSYQPLLTLLTSFACNNMDLAPVTALIGCDVAVASASAPSSASCVLTTAVEAALELLLTGHPPSAPAGVGCPAGAGTCSGCCDASASRWAACPPGWSASS